MNLSNFWVRAYIICTLSVAVFLVLLPFLPNWPFLIPISYAANFVPRWIVLFLIMPLCIFSFGSTKRILIAAFCTLSFMSYQDIQLNFFGNKGDGNFKVISLNTGAGSNANKIKQLVLEQSPDVVLLQESSKKLLKKVFDDTWIKKCQGRLCIASRIPFKQEGSMSREAFGGWGSFGVFYQLLVNNTTVSIANVHFETPRSTINSILYQSFNTEEITDLDFSRRMEASYVRAWASDKPSFIIAGDFNMPVSENIYHENFSDFNNAISDQAFGLNRTKHTSWHGIRIDHVLYSDSTPLTHVEVLSSVAGDHRPILAEFKID